MAGLLVLAGGAEFDDRMAAADRVWLARLRATPHLLLLPTANQDHPDIAGANGVRHFLGLGVDAEALMVVDAISANEGHRLQPLELADCVYMAGGYPSFLRQVLAGSRAWEALVRRWREGMALGGSSAGAMVLCQAVYLQERWSDALALVPDLVCFPHFNRRDEASAKGLAAAVAGRGLTGVGIDESTALIWDNRVWRVAGHGGVTVLGRETSVRYASGEDVPGLPAPDA